MFLFELGIQMYSKSDWILADTKYEFELLKMATYQ